ncbi:MAG: hypothetical protein ACK42L_02680 [Thermoanaerobaculum sp.]
MTSRNRLAIGLAVALLAVGLVELSGWFEGPQQPAWLPAIAPLSKAPLPAGEVVAVVFPPHLDPQRKQWVVMELYWQFPQVRWTLAPTHGPQPPWFLGAPGIVSPGRTVWQEGGWCLKRGEKSP